MTSVITMIDSSGSQALSLPRAILFDMDGVLVDSEVLHWESVHGVLRAHLGAEAPLLKQRVGWGDHDLWRELGERYSLNGDPYSLTEERGTIAMSALRASPPPEMSGALEAIIGLREEAPELILAVVSASPKDQMIQSLRDFVTPAGESLFNDLFSGVDDTSRNKPHSDPYLTAMNHYHLSPKECWIAEDSSAGLTAAIASKATVFAVGAHFADPELITYCAKEMNTLLEILDLWRELRKEL